MQNTYTELTNENIVAILKSKDKDSKIYYELLESFTQQNKTLIYYSLMKYQRWLNKDELDQLIRATFIEAIDKFDTTKNIRFMTYFLKALKFNTIREIQTIHPLGAGVYLDKLLIENEKYKEKHGRSATIEELAEITKIKKETIEVILKNQNIPSMNRTLKDNSSHNSKEKEMVDLFTNNDPMEDYSVKERYLLKNMKTYLNYLPKDYKKIILSKYYKGMTNMELGEEMGMSHQAIQQKETGAIKQLKIYTTDNGETSIRFLNAIKDKKKKCNKIIKVEDLIASGYNITPANLHNMLRIKASSLDILLAKNLFTTSGVTINRYLHWIDEESKKLIDIILNADNLNYVLNESRLSLEELKDKLFEIIKDMVRVAELEIENEDNVLVQ